MRGSFELRCCRQPFDLSRTCCIMVEEVRKAAQNPRLVPAARVYEGFLCIVDIMISTSDLDILSKSDESRDYPTRNMSVFKFY